MGTDQQPATKKSLGQHWLADETILRKIADHANLNNSDTVLEIGPGPGTLTAILAEKAGHVIAVEKDEDLAKQLPKRLKKDNVTVVPADILRFDFSELPPGYKIVANIPYYLTSKLIRIISETTNPPTCAVLLVQKEVAERIAAPPGSMSLLSVTAQFFWDVSLGQVVESRNFTPPPKVDSQIVILKVSANDWKIDDTRQFFRVVKAGFSQRRKTLMNSLSAGLRLSKTDIQKICDAADVEVGRRAQTLSLEEWIGLYQKFKDNQITV